MPPRPPRSRAGTLKKEEGNVADEAVPQCDRGAPGHARVARLRAIARSPEDVAGGGRAADLIDGDSSEDTSYCMNKKVQPGRREFGKLGAPYLNLEPQYKKSIVYLRRHEMQAG